MFFMKFNGAPNDESAKFFHIFNGLKTFGNACINHFISAFLVIWLCLVINTNITHVLRHVELLSTENVFDIHLATVFVCISKIVHNYFVK